jgi:hypothetical protein
VEGTADQTNGAGSRGERARRRGEWPLEAEVGRGGVWGARNRDNLVVVLGLQFRSKGWESLPHTLRRHHPQHATGSQSKGSTPGPKLSHGFGRAAL